MKIKKDIYWINAVRAICILAVFLLHAEVYYGFKVEIVNDLLHPFYVNAFFFISGYLLFWKQLSEPKILENTIEYINGGGKTLFLNIFYRIIIPSIVFSAIEYVPSCLIQGREIEIGQMLNKTVGGGTYWFTSALVVAELILLAMFCTRNRNLLFYIILSFAMGGAGLLIVHFDILRGGFWAWRQGLIALIFLALGGLYWKYEGLVDNLMKWWFVLPLLVTYLVIITLLKGTTVRRNNLR